MIPNRIMEYLEDNDVHYERSRHRLAIAAQELAAAIHVSGYRVAKSVLVEAGGKPWIAVLPASDVVDLERLATALASGPVRIMSESEFGPLFPDCELGAEPPFGGLYGLPVIVDTSLGQWNRIVVRAGSHEETLQLSYREFEKLERPRVATFAIPQVWPEARRAGEVRV